LFAFVEVPVITMPMHFFKKLLHDDLMVVRIHCERDIKGIANIT